MANTRTLKRSFSGGELSPEMFGRIDDAKYQSGAALLENFVSTPQGPAENRPGFQFVRATKDNGVARLIPFTYSATQTMAVELGAGYFRFHTNGETLEYAATGPAWVAPSGDISISYSTPAIATWTGHGLTSGQPIMFYLYGDYGLAELPAGFKVGYVYTAEVINANTFRILDNGVAIGLVDPSPGGSGAISTGAGTTGCLGSVSAERSFDITSTVLTGLPSVVVPGGIATIHVSVSSIIRILDGEISGGGFGAAAYEFSTDGATWHEFYSTSSGGSTALSIAIPLANINQLRLRAHVTGEASPTGSAYARATISAWSVDVPGAPITNALTVVRAYRNYAIGDVATHGGHMYVALTTASGTTTPGTDSAVWSQLPSDLTYEIPNSYAAEDLFDIHYAQSADVMTLVHPKYPPSELKRRGATNWTFTPISAVPLLSSPTQVSAVASPGYLAKISASDYATPSKLTTATSHTLALGDGVYATDLVIGGATKSDFYMVSKVPIDGTGALIPDQLYLMDYQGNKITVSSLGSNPTIQYGSKIFDITNHYVVTALTSDGVNESSISQEVSVLNNLNVTGSYNTIAWAAVASAARYYVYKKKNGLFGYIGQTTGLTFSDNNIAPDFSITPPTYETMFNGAGNYPGAVSYFDQRRCFGGTKNNPQDVWMSKTGTEADFSYSIPVKDTDRIYFRVASREANTIQHIVPLAQLLLMTNSAELRVSPVNSDAITPSDIAVRPQSYVGASSVQPSMVNNSLVYCASRGGHVREMGYSWQSNGFVTGDLSLRAAHLFDNLTVADQCFSKSPLPIVWFVSSNGNLVGLTYIPEEQIGAWHHHTTNGVFESVTAVAEGSEDRLYAVIRRTINGETVRYVERMASRMIDESDPATWFFVDAGATYSGSPVAGISGLTWLEGETVSVLADGAVQQSKVVTGGSITLDHAASVVHVGLPYNSDVKTLPLTLEMEAFGQGRPKNINKVFIRVWKSSGIWAGFDADHLREYKQRTTEPYGAPPRLQTREVELTLPPAWQQDGQILIRQSAPLPMTIVGVTLEVSIGG